LSINEESWVGLTAVRGIGPVLARSIVFEREKRGGFTRLDEILNVQGIGSKLYRKIRHDLIL
jgi:competence protein ComEA